MDNLLDPDTIVRAQKLALSASRAFLRAGHNRLVVVVSRKNGDGTESDTDAACLAEFSVYGYVKFLFGHIILSFASDDHARPSVVTPAD